MLIDSVTIRNFRSIREEVLNCQDMTVLVGSNGTGKSSFLRALDLFYTAGARPKEDDYTHGNIEAPIEISVSYKDFSAAEVERFSSYIHHNNLIVKRMFHCGGGKDTGKYFGMTLQHPDFKEIRNAPSKSEFIKAYKLISDKFGLEAVRSADAADDQMTRWEQENSGECELVEDAGQFLGFENVGAGSLSRWTKFLFIPAVRDASLDAVEGKGSPISQLMDWIVRSSLQQREDIKEFREEAEKRYKELTDPTKIPELNRLGTAITSTLKDYYSGVDVKLQWQGDAEVSMGMPKADVRLLEDGFESPVGNVGHGLQRAFILALLQQLMHTNAQVMEETDGGEKLSDEMQVEFSLPGLILAIEEPELYQHPNKQRHFSRVLSDMSQNRIHGIADNTQVLYATHSPLFLNFESFDDIRVVRKVEDTMSNGKVSKVSDVSVGNAARRLWEANGSVGEMYTGESLRPRLHIMNSILNEGFFAAVVVLVEGEDDKAALLGASRMLLKNTFESMEIAVLSCGGKNNLDRPYLIFESLGIPVYVVWDSDKGGSKPEENHKLLRLLEEDVVDWPCTVTNKYACLEKNLEKTIGEEIGKEFYDALVDSKQAEYSLKKKAIIKNPVVLGELLKEAHEQERESKTLDAIVNAIVELRRSSSPLSEVHGE